jgi:hypothetical protein
MRNQNEDRGQNRALSDGLVRTISDRISLLPALLGGLFWLIPFQPTFSGAPSETPSPAITLDPLTRASVIEAAAKALEDKYIFPDVGKQKADKIRQNNSSCEYNALTTPARSIIIAPVQVHFGVVVWRFS